MLCGCFQVTSLAINPYDWPLVQNASYIAAFSFIFAGAAFVSVFFLKSVQLALPDSTTLEAENSYYHKKQYWVLYTLALIGFIAFFESMYLGVAYARDYHIVTAILDLAFTVVLMYYLVRGLYGNQFNDKYLARLTIIYAVVSAALFVYVGAYFAVLGVLLSSCHLWYSVACVNNQKTFRIANFLLLPLSIISGIIVTQVSSASVKEAYFRLDHSESRFNEQTATLSSTIAQINNADNVDLAKAKTLQDTLVKAEDALAEYEENVRAARLVLGDNIDVQSILSIRELDYVLLNTKIYEDQLTYTKDFLTYFSSLPARPYSKTDREKIQIFIGKLNDSEEVSSEYLRKSVNPRMRFSQ